jgi:hypothetical protein
VLRWIKKMDQKAAEADAIDSAAMTAKADIDR